jgi:excisionase family DNA binding protein
MVDRVAYRVREAAKALGVSERTVRRMVATGELRARRRGRLVLIPARELERFVGAELMKQERPSAAARRFVDSVVGARV